MLTGQSAHNSGMLGLAHRGFSLKDVKQHLQYTLQQHGYTTVLAGLQHITTETPDTWERLGYDTGLNDIEAEDEIGRMDRYSVAHIRAAKFLENHPPEPFFLNVGFLETHRPFYDPDEEEIPFTEPPCPLPDVLDTRQDMNAFMQTAAIFDRKAGVVLDALKKNGLAENTLVICTTDHGIPFPFMKCNLTDHGTGVMLILRGPQGISGGKAIDALVSHLDIFPTICDIIGIEAPVWLQGKSLLPLLRGETDEINRYVFSEVNFHAAYEPQRMVRTKRWKYIRRFDGKDKPVLPNIDDGPSKSFLLDQGLADNPHPQEMLYDLVYDPNETDNQIDDPAYAEILGAMRKTLEDWMVATKDPLLEYDVIPFPEGAGVNDVDAMSPIDWETITQEEHLKKARRHLKHET